MNTHSPKFTTAKSTTYRGNTGAPERMTGPRQSEDAAVPKVLNLSVSNRSAVDAAIIAPGQPAARYANGTPKVSGGNKKAGTAGETATYSHCPDCDGPFSYRITDEDTGCSYPVDDGEHYCGACDSLWTDEYLGGWLLAEQSALNMGRGETPLEGGRDG